MVCVYLLLIMEYSLHTFPYHNNYFHSFRSFFKKPSHVHSNTWSFFLRPLHTHVDVFDEANVKKFIIFPLHFYLVIPWEHHITWNSIAISAQIILNLMLLKAFTNPHIQSKSITLWGIVVSSSCSPIVAHVGRIYSKGYWTFTLANYNLYIKWFINLMKLPMIHNRQYGWSPLHVG